MTALLARYAENLFWMGRYMERAENLARILEVQESFARDAHGAQNWLSVVQLNADEERFFKRYDSANGPAITQFYICDGDNPTSLLSTVRAARECARALRPLISTELWSHLNVFFNRVKVIAAQGASPRELPAICSVIKESCQAHAGIAEGTLHRDQSWYFLQLGRHLERADQTTRLLDIKYHLLLPSPNDVGSALDVSQWNTVLRCAAGYHAFRRLHPRGMSPKAVAGFLLFNDAFPRSVLLCINQVDTLLHQLRTGLMLRGGYHALERIDEIRAVLNGWSMDAVIKRGLHEFLDWIQLMLGYLSLDIARDFLGWIDAPHNPTPPLVRDGMYQSQN